MLRRQQAGCLTGRVKRCTPEQVNQQCDAFLTKRLTFWDATQDASSDTQTREPRRGRHPEGAPPTFRLDARLADLHLRLFLHFRFSLL